MQNLLILFILSYLIGSIPFGLIVTKIVKNEDVRTIESGRTGATNVMRAAGFLAGLITMLLDIMKGVSTVWLTTWLAPGQPWAQVVAALLIIIGHNYSIYLIERKEDGKIRLRGGAGGTPAVGGAIALWPPSVLIILPVAILVFVFVGYASVTSMSIGITAILIFIFRASIGLSPWVFIVYGLVAELLILWSLRPNIRRLKAGTERIVGLRAYLKKKALRQNSEGTEGSEGSV